MFICPENFLKRISEDDFQKEIPNRPTRQKSQTGCRPLLRADSPSNVIYY